MEVTGSNPVSTTKMNNIKITLPDKSIKDFKFGTTGDEMLLINSEGLHRSAIAIKTDGDLIDLNTPLTKDSSVEIITNRDEDAHHILLP